MHCTLEGGDEVYSDEWTLVETLGDEGSSSVIAMGGKVTDWRSRARALPTGVDAVVRRAHRDGRRVDVHLEPSRTRRGGDRVTAIPVLGPEGVVHAVLVRVGVNPELPSTPNVAGVTISAQDWTLEASAEAYAFYDLRRPEGRAIWTAPEAFRVIERFDDALALISAIADSKPADRWQGSVSLHTPQGVRVVQVAMRNGVGRDRTRWRGVLHDIIDPDAPMTVSLEAATLQLLRKSVSGVHIALMEVGQARVLHWITDRPDDVQWRGLVDERKAAHPDDEQSIRAAIVGVEGVEHTELRGVRLRRIGGGWKIIDGSATVLPHRGTPQLILVQFTVVGESDEPDPVPPPGP